ncbi:hypothetical protein HX99_06890 [Peptococcaceae bacterium SCADC1_2_3]|nr:hypothetical protein DK28_0213360 [Peptococcaceae bacterium SCADC1_2_3]KFI36893.1 hypothetical protein HX99_06890 [Peptococcaceae bacterium SCADC1_2_3]KFI37971.1 hypothetical protein HY02_00515 [Peptococcaceae bacterium SCADC1_2_3]
MRAKEYCYQCLEGLTRRTAKLAGQDPAQEEAALKKGLAYLNSSFSFSAIPTQLAGELQRVIRTATGNKDPFANVKKKEMALAAALVAEIKLKNDLPSLLALAALGNSIDFFVDLDTIKKELQSPVRFARDNIKALEDLLTSFKIAKKRQHILYFADNAGECFFDQPLFQKLEEYAEVVYVVKENPAQNDLTLKDLQNLEIGAKFKKVITTGTDTPGLDLSLVSKSFYETLTNTDLLLAKGMGYYETLPELSLSQKIFYLFKAKCPPIANSLSVPLNSYIAIFKD